MKKIKILAPVTAFIFAIGFTFALAGKPAVDQALYYVDQSGNPTQPVGGPTPNCITSALKCAQMFQVVNGQPTQAIPGTLINGTRVQ